MTLFIIESVPSFVESITKTKLDKLAEGYKKTYEQR